MGLDVRTGKGHVSRDHVHMLLGVPPRVSVSRLMQGIRGRASRKMLVGFRVLKKEFWGRHLWARGYFAASVGNVTDEVVRKYIGEQEELKRDQDDGFRVEGE